MGNRSLRGRRTTVLIELAYQRFHACEVCCKDKAVRSIRDALNPLKLRRREIQRLMRNLTCPACESPIRDYYYDAVAVYEPEQLRDHRRIDSYLKKYRVLLDSFHAFLLRYPSLGGLHQVGRLLTNAAKRAKVRSLEPSIWYHARPDHGKFPSVDEYLPRNPAKVERRAGRFNHGGQDAYYVAQAPETAAIEMTGTRSPSKRVWISPVRIVRSLKVLDLRIQMCGESEPLPLLLSGLIYQGIISACVEEDLSYPQYRIPQFIADLLRWKRVDGVLYTRTRDSGFHNPEAFGENLVLLSPKPGDVDLIEEAQLYSWQEDYGDVLYKSVNLHRVGEPPSFQGHQMTIPKLS
jgi:hypothetical protein